MFWQSSIKLTYVLFFEQNRWCYQQKNLLQLDLVVVAAAASVPHLHTTLTCLFYIDGRCIIATALAPLNGTHSLVYGSCDAAKTISKTGTISLLIHQFSVKYNLRRHTVLDRNSQAYDMDVAVDVEGHFGGDGLYYLIDLARVFPPELPRRGTADVWWKQFRPEFLQQYCFKLPLSSDAYTNFGREDFEEDMHRGSISKQLMLDNAIPILVKHLTGISIILVLIKLSFQSYKLIIFFSILHT